MECFYGGLRTYVSTFFVFSDYVKPMSRLSALMNIPQIFVLTHDSIGVGEDGLHCEPIEQLSMLRAMPNFNVYRPADATETAIAADIRRVNKSSNGVTSVEDIDFWRTVCIEGARSAYIIRKEKTEKMNWNNYCKWI